VLLCPSDDTDRIRQEELRGFGVDIVPVPALGAAALLAAARDLLPPGARWRCDRPGFGLEHDASVDLLRRTLLPEETERLRKLALDAATAVEEVATECYRGIIERDAAARLASECVRRQITPRIILAGADERLDQYPRPLPKGASASHVLGLGLVARRGGLNVVLSRTVCLARPAVSLLDRFDTLARLAARLRHESRPGETLGKVVQRALPLGLLSGSPGGVAAYLVPEEEARSTSGWKLEPGQALAWTLATPGGRCEDTTLLEPDGCSLLTATENWPRRAMQLGGQSYEVPDLLLL
jgi:hypothetical protein